MFNVKIVTPKGIKFSGDADFVEFTTVDGSMGVLEKRLPIITKLKVSALKIKSNDKTELFAVNGGILDMNGKELTVLTTDAERPEDIDVETAMKAVEEAKNQLKITNDKIDKTKIQSDIEKNMVRINIGKTK